MRAPGMRSTSHLKTKAGDVPDYLPYIRSGLPKPAHKRNIAIVGAGVAGLCAASLLAQAGHKVAIFEASKRIGGRILTVREPFSSGLYGEAGAMRLPSFYKLALATIERLGLSTNTFYNEDQKAMAWIYVNGHKMRKSEYNEKRGRGLGFPLIAGEEGILAQDLLNTALKPIADYVGKDPLEGYVHNRWGEVVARYGEMSVREFLKSQTFYSEGAIEMIEVLVDLESRADQALIQQIVEINDHGPGVNYVEITGGMDHLPNALGTELKRLHVPIHFDRRLTEVIREGESGRVTLHFDLISDTLGTRKQDTFVADDVILTVPFPGMRYVQANPPFSHNKRKAIRELHYDASTKILLEFKTRFWELNDGIFGGNSITDLPSRFIYYPSHGWNSGGPGVLISSYTWGDEARGWDSFAHDDQIRFAIDDLAKIHGDYIRKEFVTGFVQSWATDRFSHGEAAMFYGGQLEELQPYIPKAEGHVHFAGEHTSLKHAWIEGSIESAIRAALEINS